MLDKKMLKAFLFVLMRDHLTFGEIESIFEHHLVKLKGKSVSYSGISTNTEKYAEELVDRFFTDVQQTEFPLPIYDDPKGHTKPPESLPQRRWD